MWDIFLVVKLMSLLRKLYGRHHDLVNRYRISVWQKICSVCRNQNAFFFSRMTYHQVCNKSNTTGATNGAGTVYPSGARSSSPVFSGIRVTRSLVLYVCFVDRCLSFCTFSFGHCVVCSSSKYGLWLPLWYLQTLLSVVRVAIFVCFLRTE